MNNAFKFFRLIVRPLPKFLAKPATLKKLRPFNEFLNSKAGFFVYVTGFSIVIYKMINQNYITQKIEWRDIAIEGSGLILDFIFFGIIVTLYEKFTENHRERLRLMDEIRDFRDWNSKEAMFKICGAIKRLNTLGVSAIDLQYCYLKGANLSGRRCPTPRLPVPF
jgi:hypothetical protein